MNLNNVVIESYATYLPDKIITSEEIEDLLTPAYDRLHLPKGRLELMTGIKERRQFLKTDLPSTLSTIAANKLFNTSKVLREDVDLLIHASVSRNFLEPATASVVHHNLKLSDHCHFFDLSNACLGFMNAIAVAASMIQTGAIKNALIVSGENASKLLNATIKELNENLSISRKSSKKYFANLTIGSGAVAFMLSSASDHEGLKLTGATAMSKSDAVTLCEGDNLGLGQMMQTDSEELLHAGLELAKNNFQKFKNTVNPKLDFVIGHQVGVAHEKLIFEALNVDKIKTHRTYPIYGNTGSAALPITLAELLDSGATSQGDSIGLLGIGSGLSSIMMEVIC